MLTVGSLFTGAGGLDQAVEAHFGAETIWRSDIKPASVKLIEHYWPGTNLGDITTVDWVRTPRVDILTGGFPCTDVSQAGKRAGLIRYGDNTRTGLWGHMARAVDILRPSLVVAENVRGLLSGKADRPTPMGPAAESVEEGELRALGAVLGDLADIGYDAAWCGLRASDVGACHQRFRVFLLAWPTTGNADGMAGAAGRSLEGQRGALGEPRAIAGTVGSDGVAGQPDGLTLLPTPTVVDMGGNKTVDEWDTWTEAMKARHGNGNGHGASLNIEAQRSSVDWGKYEAAIRRHELMLGRPAPHPTEEGPKGGRRLSPALTEWMMGWPEGWTDVPGLSRSQRLSLCGDGVVTQQAMAALAHLEQIAGGHAEIA